MTAGQCFLKRGPFPVNIEPGETVQVDLQPAGSSAPIQPGVYRLALTFRVLDDDKMPSDYFVVFSPLLRVTGMPQREAVSVSVDGDRYLKGQAIQVTVDNNTDRTIRTFDHQTYCSIVTVQRLQDGNWINVGKCLLASPTRLVKIASRQSVAGKLPPAPFTGDFEPGVYRVEFTFEELDDREQEVVRRVKIYSAQFSIVARE
ncbi:MAG: immunoglobulin-like domain-containing protein [Blastocatellia bacterium]